METINMQTSYAEPPCLPSFNNLTIGRVLPYDVDAYIYGTPSTLPIPPRYPYDNYTPRGIVPHNMPQAPNSPVAPKSSTKVQKTDKFLNKVGITALFASAVIAVGAFFKKKLPEHAITKAIQSAGDYLKTLPSKIGKLFKETPKS